MKTCNLEMMPGKEEWAPQDAIHRYHEEVDNGILGRKHKGAQDRKAWRERSCAAGASNVRNAKGRKDNISHKVYLCVACDTTPRAAGIACWP